MLGFPETDLQSCLLLSLIAKHVLGVPSDCAILPFPAKFNIKCGCQSRTAFNSLIISDAPKKHKHKTKVKTLAPNYDSLGEVTSTRRCTERPDHKSKSRRRSTVCQCTNTDTVEICSALWQHGTLRDGRRRTHDAWL